ncbi:hypothetical protein ACS0TY_000116 [Phlomoides rotata]
MWGDHLQQEYIRGISAWNFNMEDLRNQAALIQDDRASISEDSSVSRTLTVRMMLAPLWIGC